MSLLAAHKLLRLYSDEKFDERSNSAAFFGIGPSFGGHMSCKNFKKLGPPNANL